MLISTDIPPKVAQSLLTELEIFTQTILDEPYITGHGLNNMHERSMQVGHKDFALELMRWLNAVENNTKYNLNPTHLRR